MNRFIYYRHIRCPDYRMVLMIGTVFPSSLDQTDWVRVEERADERVHGEVRDEISLRGVSFYKQNVTVKDIDDDYTQLKP
ncbi:hypothetical protein [Rhizobium sp. BK060]|uniref:hypothetical protein n=1 Tax=Rhizobium sp. BK060 TaxID=2587096 RepID=UPI00160B655A|nr:hypothetical protein [Rhizobium sp. BK060]MBB3396164.1 hypothetical protein [Rhizobium sp. BK060]